ncbi:MAG: nitronate monooxygenase [Actinobacteria bacterium]|nr:nitronate monooxygenase [Actinomycetota bacterium]
MRTPLCDLAGVEFPIVQTGMGWVAGPRLTSATAAAGGLGILASATMTFDELVKAVHEVQDRTDRPFGVNLRSDQDDVADRIDLLAREHVKVASFANAPGEALVKRCKDRGLVVLPTVGAARHAEKCQAWGADAVIAQGHEGGGHTGPVPTSLLLPTVVGAVDIPVVAAGGFFDGRGLVAALAYGAAGIAMGTRFLLTQESTVPDAVKRVYLDTGVTGTIVTDAIDGAPQRVIRTQAVERIARGGRVTGLPRAAWNAFRLRKLTGSSMRALLREGRAMRAAQELTWAQVAMAANAPMLTRATMVEGRLESGILPTGQVVGVIGELPAVAEVVEAVMREAEAVLARLSGNEEGK